MKYSELITEGLYYDGHPLSKYWLGDCPIFAIALHKLTGFQLHGLVEFDSNLNTNVLIHAYVKTPSGDIVDASGNESSVGDILEEFPNDGNAQEVQFTVGELLAIGYNQATIPSLDFVLPIAKELLGELHIPTK